MSSSEFHPQESKNMHILHGQNYACRCPGDARSQGISKHAIDLVSVEYSVAWKDRLIQSAAIDIANFFDILIKWERQTYNYNFL